MANGYQGAGSYAGYGDPARVKLDRQRQLAEMLSQGATDTSPKGYAEGIAQLGKAWIASQAQGRADAAESAYATDKARRLAQFFNPKADEQGRNLAPDVNVSADPAPAPAQADPRIRSLATALGGVYEGDGKTQPMGMTAAPMADVGEPSFSVGAPVSMPMSAAQMPKPAPDQNALMQQALRYTGGDYQQAMAMVEAKIAPARDAEALSYARGQDAATAKRAADQAATQASQWQQTFDQSGSHYDQTLAATATHNRAMERAAEAKASQPRGGLTGIQGLNFQFKLDDLDKDNAAENQKDKTSVTSLNNTIALLDQYTDKSTPENEARFNEVYGNTINPSGKGDDWLNWKVPSGSPRANGMAMLDQLGGQAFLASITAMRGSGALSDAEGAKLTNAATRLMIPTLSDDEARTAATEFRAALTQSKTAVQNYMTAKAATQQQNRARMQAMMAAASGSEPQQGDINLSQLTPEQLDQLDQQLSQGGQ